MARLMLLVSSNNRIDRDGEIVTEQALADYVARSHNADGQYIGANVLLWWHGGQPIGKIIECDLLHGFLVEIAQELPNATVTVGKQEYTEQTTISAIWDMVEKAPNEFGVSQGFEYLEDDKEGVIYHRIYKNESSILPVDKASNIFTGCWVISR